MQNALKCGWVFCVLGCVMGGSSAVAQVQNVAQSTSTPQQGSMHSYAGTSSEMVNPADGSLNFHLSIPLPPGRGLNVPLSIVYGSKGVSSFQDSNYGPVYNFGAPEMFSQNGWSYTIPHMLYRHQTYQLTDSASIYCEWKDNYVLSDPSGGKHALRLIQSVANGPFSNVCPENSTISTGGDDFYHVSTGSDTGQWDPLLAADADGTVYSFTPNLYSDENMSSGPGSVPPGTGAKQSDLVQGYPSSIEDRNGNEIHIQPVGSNLAYIDTLGRQLVTLAGNAMANQNGTDQISVSGLPSPYQITWSPSSTGYSYPISFNLNPVQQGECVGVGPVSITGSLSNVSRITLPDSTFYEFSYDPTYGVINSITFPGGDKVTYDWEIIPSYEFGRFHDLVVVSVGQGSPVAMTYCGYQYDIVGVKARHVFSGENEVETQTFSYSGSLSGGSQTVVATTDHVRGQTTTTTYQYGGTYVPYNGWIDPQDDGFYSYNAVETQEQVQEANGTIAQTTKENWWDANNLQAKEVTVGSGGPTSFTTYQYGGGTSTSMGSLLTEEDDYDFNAAGQINFTQLAQYPPGAASTVLQASAPPTKKTVIQYQPFPDLPTYTAGPALFDKPSSIQTFSGSTLVAETDYVYDNASVQGTPSDLAANVHDEANYNAGSTAPRGNATRVTKRCLPGCADEISHNIYFETGLIASSTDGDGNTTSYDYTDSPLYGNSAGYSFAYLTSITYPPFPAVDGITPAPLSKSFSYNYQSGEIVQSVDENNQPTTYSYNDPFLRLTDVYGPPSYQNEGKQSHSSTTYVDGPSGTITSIDPDGVKTIAYLDGKGRVFRTELATDPIGPVYVDTQYDGVGNVLTVLNPYRSSTDSTSGLTTYLYDALGRLAIRQNPDLTISQICYNGVGSLGQTNCLPNKSAKSSTSWQDISDEAGNHSQRQMDAFGQLVSVMEPNSTDVPSIETDYQYDALGNFLRVDQWGGSSGSVGEEARTFTYNSLSELLCASNPENSANACPSSSAGTIPSSVTAYTYDAAGNLSTKSEAGGPVITYKYDPLNRIQSKLTNGTTYQTFTYDQGTYGRGRLYSAATNLLQEYAEVEFNYDESGRVVGGYWLDPKDANWMSGMSVQYDLAGRATKLTYPDGRIISQAWNNAGQLGLISDITNGSPGTTLLGGPQGGQVQYGPSGAVTSLQFGNGFTQSDTFNNRLQLCHTMASSPALPPNGSLGNLIDRYAYHSSLATNNCGNEASNNGNIWEIKDNLQGGLTQQFTYDALNRLQTASRSDNSYNHTYNLDAFGNMLFQDNVYTSPNYSIDSATNRLLLNKTDFQYNANGTLASSPGNVFTYTPDDLLQSTETTGVIRYLYDPFGERIFDGADFGERWKEHVFLHGQVLADLDSSTTWTDYIYAGAQKIAAISTSGTSYLVGDHLGSTEILLDDQANLTWQAQYTPYGLEVVNGSQLLPTANDGAYTMPYKFTGTERDVESGLDYFGARYYGSMMGRFISPDPSGMAFVSLSNPQSLNLYSYAQNNPVNKIDPDGRECLWSDGSYDSKDDPSTGSSGQCASAGGQWIEPDTMTRGSADWTNAPNRGLADYFARGQELAAEVASGALGAPDFSSATGGGTSTSGMTTTINLVGDDWVSTQTNTGTHPFRDNNPGDIVSGGFTNRNGAVGSDGRFGVFPSADAGHQALDNLLHGQTYINRTIGGAIAIYAPGFENNTASYQQFLTNALGVSANTPLSSLSPAQFQTLENAIARYEGTNAPGYSVTTTTTAILP